VSPQNHRSRRSTGAKASPPGHPVAPDRYEPAIDRVDLTEAHDDLEVGAVPMRWRSSTGRRTQRCPTRLSASKFEQDRALALDSIAEQSVATSCGAPRSKIVVVPSATLPVDPDETGDGRNAA
jgi:hypothetical protein